MSHDISRYIPLKTFVNSHRCQWKPREKSASGAAASQKSSAKISGMLVEEKSLEHLDAVDKKCFFWFSTIQLYTSYVYIYIYTQYKYVYSLYSMYM